MGTQIWNGNQEENELWYIENRSLAQSQQDSLTVWRLVGETERTPSMPFKSHSLNIVGNTED